MLTFYTKAPTPISWCFLLFLRLFLVSGMFSALLAVF